MPIYVEELSSAAVVAATLDGRRALSLSSTAEAVSSVDERPYAVLSSTAAVSATLTGTQYVEESVASTADVAAQATISQAIVLTSSAVVAGAATFRHAAVISESAHITSSILGTGNVSVVELSSGAVVTDTLFAAIVAALESSAVVASAFAGVKVTANETSTANVTAAVTPNGFSHVSLESEADIASAVTTQLRAQEQLSSLAYVESFVRLPSAAAQVFWTNTKTMAGATWDHLPVNSIVEKGGVLYGAAVDGVHELTQAGTHEGAVTWDLLDFGSPQQKQLQAVYLSGTAGGAMTVRIANEDGAWEYDTHLTAATTKTVNHRATPGRGLKSADYRITVKAGHVFDIGDVSLIIAEAKRRIGG